MALQRKKRTNINGIDGLIQIDEYLDILNRFGIPTSASDSLDADSLLPFKILFNTTLNKLRIFNTITELWQDAIEIDLSQFYTKSEIDLLFSDVNIQLTRLNGLTLEANTATSTLYLKDIDGNILSTLSLGFLNNEGTTFVYNPTTLTLDLINDELTILSSIPVSSFISNLVSQIDFNSTLTNRLELKDSGNNVLAFVDITINNILDLQNILDGKEPTITILPVNKGGTGKNTITESSFYVGGSNNTLTEKTIQEVFDLLLTSGNGINFTNTSISVLSANTDRIIVTPQGIDLPQISIIPGTYSKVTIDNYGRVIGVDNLTLNDFSARLNTIANTTSIGIITIDDNGNINIRAIEGSSGRITIQNSSMAAGNSIIDLVPTPVVPGTYNNITVDIYGRVISASNTPIPTSLEDLTNPTVNPFVRDNDLPTSLEDLTNPTVNPFVRENILHDNIKLKTPPTIFGETKYLVRNSSTGQISEQTPLAATITHTQLTYTSSPIFTIPQNSQIISVVINELRHLNATKYTYNPLLATNNFEITDPTFLLDWEAGTEIEIVTQ